MSAASAVLDTVCRATSACLRVCVCIYTDAPGSSSLYIPESASSCSLEHPQATLPSGAVAGATGALADATATCFSECSLHSGPTQSSSVTSASVSLSLSLSLSCQKRAPPGGCILPV
jgi:hypothetical protein